MTAHITSPQVEPELAHQFVGRLRTLEDLVGNAIDKCAFEDQYTRDLLVIAQTAVNKAVVSAWRHAPDFPKVQL